MIKNLKLNIKNTQLSKILKKTSSNSKTSVEDVEEKKVAKAAKSSSLPVKEKSALLKKKSALTTSEFDEPDARPKVQLHKKKEVAAKAAPPEVAAASDAERSSQVSSSKKESVKTEPEQEASNRSHAKESTQETAKQSLEESQQETLTQNLKATTSASGKVNPVEQTQNELNEQNDLRSRSPQSVQLPKQPQSSASLKDSAQVSSSTFARTPQVGHGSASRTPLRGTDPASSRAARPPARKPYIRESFSAQQARLSSQKTRSFQPSQGTASSQRVRLGPTGKHINDLKDEVRSSAPAPRQKSSSFSPNKGPARDAVSPGNEESQGPSFRNGPKKKSSDQDEPRRRERSTLRPSHKMGKADLMRSMDEDGRWRKRRVKKSKSASEVAALRPSTLTVRTPILVKDLAAAMKLKAAELVGKLFLQGVAITLNDYLDDETTIALLGQEFGCEITIDTSEEEMIAVTSQSILEEIENSPESEIINRPPVIAFMGHVDHGKTSLIDRIRSSNRVEGESGSITQHIAAFKCETSHGPLTILDTPGHAAFEDMRERGAKVTDVIVLVVAGDDGIMPQTDEAIRHAKSVNATIVVAINKCDKPSFDVDQVYRQLSERELLPEAWGGQTITVNCSAKTGEGVDTLLELVALQSEVLELRANGSSRARGTVIEAQLHKGLGNVATVLVQNGSLNHGDSLVLGCSWGRVKTLRNEYGADVPSVAPGLPAYITGLDSLPSAGDEFIVVPSEKEARNIASARLEQRKEQHIASSRKSLDSLFAQAGSDKKVYNVIIRADVQGSLEALQVALVNIKSDKIEVKVVDEGIGEISESDVELAAASDATIVGFHTQVEPHTVDLIKEKGICVKCFDVIYHAVDGVKTLMRDALDKLPEERELGVASVKAVFKSSHTGRIAGCLVTEGKVERGMFARILREGKEIAKTKIASLRRENDDAKEVLKGYECGIVFDSFKEIAVDDEIQVFTVVYIDQEL